MKKECMICGNTNEDELEEITLHSDEDGNDAQEKQWFCKEDEPCS